MAESRSLPHFENTIKGKNVCFYWMGQDHYYDVSIDYGVKHIRMTEGQGRKAIELLRAIGFKD